MCSVLSSSTSSISKGSTSWKDDSCFLSGSSSSFASSETSISRKSSPSLTSSPILTKTLLTMPVFEAGTSIAAFSDSRTTIESSVLTLSPALTQISITSVFSASPKLGIFTTCFIYSFQGEFLFLFKSHFL